jgi:hypothetical protein
MSIPFNPSIWLVENYVEKYGSPVKYLTLRSTAIFWRLVVSAYYGNGLLQSLFSHDRARNALPCSKVRPIICGEQLKGKLMD